MLKIISRINMLILLLIILITQKLFILEKNDIETLLSNLNLNISHLKHHNILLKAFYFSSMQSIKK